MELTIKKLSGLNDFVAFSWIGITLAIIVALGFFSGAWLDKKLNTAPLFIIIFVLGGVALGFLRVYFSLVGKNKTDSRNNNDDQKEE